MRSVDGCVRVMVLRSGVRAIGVVDVGGCRLGRRHSVKSGVFGTRLSRQLGDSMSLARFKQHRS